ncbi:MAG: serine hydroxymethyltransferase [Candidatus Diapherotrites archaeon]|uniref:Serine hydroxymethyltransferase n=1 Tax=Candidatus Iainarchaeum sp. TaxID=3101447 RepID=A0A2D6M173_9ARCH|nr:serine hydroxymethyltransferase [Candidatus Diapherotrites archaeon]
MHLDFLKDYDPDIFKAIVDEKDRQMDGIELIPSENLVSQGVLEAMGSVPNNKYSEGYPGKRYYGGNEFIDIIENLAIDRLKELFGAEHANVQLNSGSPANMAAYYAAMEIGDTFMGLKLTEGGHLTHGHPVNFSGKLYNCEQYGVSKEDERLDYDAILKQAKELKPKLILSGYTAYPREIDFKKFREICDEVGAVCMADISHIGGLCATGIHENPVPYFDIVTTTTHKTLRGPRSAVIMCKEEFATKIDKAVFPGLQGGPHEHIIAAKAVAFKEALEPNFKNYTEQIVKNAKAMAEGLMDAGLRLVTDGTDNHLILVDTFGSKQLTGKEAEHALELAGIYCNKNTIPFDERTPWDPSGIRIGTPVLTTRGMKESDMKEVADFMVKVLDNAKDESKLAAIKVEVKEFCASFPFYK